MWGITPILTPKCLSLSKSVSPKKKEYRLIVMSNEADYFFSKSNHIDV